MSARRTATVHSVVIWPFFEAVRKLGLVIPEVPELADARAPDARIPQDNARGWLDLAVQLTGRPDLGVLAAEAVEPGHFELVELASRAQASVGEGLRTLSSLVTILHDSVVVKLVQGPEVARLQISLGDWALHPAGYDFIVASLVIAGRRQTRIADLEPSVVRLPCPKPTYPAPLSRLLTCAIEYDAPQLELEFKSEALVMPLARANPSLGQALHEAARGLLNQGNVPSALERQVREQVIAGLGSGELDAAGIARRLHMSERTLRRRLDAEGLGLRQLVDDERRVLAMRKLGDASLSTEAVASQLGFTTPQAFHRAFKRWTGDTVQAFRARKR